MSQKKYTYQPENLRFVSLQRDWKRVLLKGLPLSLLSIIPGIATYFILSGLHSSHQELHLRAENHKLKSKYHQLYLTVEELSNQVDTIEKKDDRIYRSLLGVAPLDSTIRLAGIGGNRIDPQKYSNYHELIKQTADGIDKVQSRLLIEQNSLNKILNLASKNKDRMLHLPAIMPISNQDLSYTGSGFGMRFHPILKIRRKHEGLDFIAPHGSDVYATANGLVVEARVSSTFGNIIEIDHGYGYLTLYAHLKAFNVKVGQKVSRGDVIGWVGNTGLSSGTHLHYEIHSNGKEINPINYFFNDLSAKEYEEIKRRANAFDTSLD